MKAVGEKRTTMRAHLSFEGGRRMFEEYHGTHRDEIRWNPTIDYDKCVNCETCVEVKI